MPKNDNSYISFLRKGGGIFLSTLFSGAMTLVRSLRSVAVMEMIEKVYGVMNFYQR